MGHRTSSRRDGTDGRVVPYAGGLVEVLHPVRLDDVDAIAVGGTAASSATVHLVRLIGDDLVPLVQVGAPDFTDGSGVSFTEGVRWETDGELDVGTGTAWGCRPGRSGVEAEIVQVVATLRGDEATVAITVHEVHAATLDVVDERTVTPPPAEWDDIDEVTSAVLADEGAIRRCRG